LVTFYQGIALLALTDNFSALHTMKMHHAHDIKWRTKLTVVALGSKLYGGGVSDVASYQAL
jgi:hypothetical protein